ncbi:MAG: hypothetical protein JWN27_1363 [Candidatus Eremiobacteraeota bacterium]|nr:hypothetical protein [Candidatus Eremiobacteraeota bacterium]
MRWSSSSFTAVSAALFSISLCAGGANAATEVISVPTGGGGVTFSLPHPIATEVARQPGPVRIDGCFSDGRAAQGLTIVHHALRITNTGDRPIAAVRVRFAFYDAFGDVQTSRTNIADTRIGPGQTADRINLAELADAGPPAKISCSVDAVRYADGTLAKSSSP